MTRLTGTRPVSPFKVIRARCRVSPAGCFATPAGLDLLRSDCLTSVLFDVKASVLRSEVGVTGANALVPSPFVRSPPGVLLPYSPHACRGARLPVHVTRAPNHPVLLPPQDGCAHRRAAVGGNEETSGIPVRLMRGSPCGLRQPIFSALDLPALDKPYRTYPPVFLYPIRLPKNRTRLSIAGEQIGDGSWRILHCRRLALRHIVVSRPGFFGGDP